MSAPIHAAVASKRNHDGREQRIRQMRRLRAIRGSRSPRCLPDDGGEHWRVTTSDPRPALRVGGGDLPILAVDPKNADVLYSASIVTMKSTDGGAHWFSFKGAPGGDGISADVDQPRGFAAHRLTRLASLQSQNRVTRFGCTAGGSNPTGNFAPTAVPLFCTQRARMTPPNFDAHPLI
jgi:hypothetical protein